MRKYEESKTTRIMMATLPHVTSGLGLRKFQAGGFLLTRVYKERRKAFLCSLGIKGVWENQPAFLDSTKLVPLEKKKR